MNVFLSPEVKYTKACHLRCKHFSIHVLCFKNFILKYEFIANLISKGWMYLLLAHK